MLLELMIAIAIFAVAVIGIAKSINSCLTAVRITREEAAITRLLSNRMTEINASQTLPDKHSERRVATPVAAVRLIEECKPLDGAANQNNERLAGLYEVVLRAEWQSDRTQNLTRDLSFFILRLGR